MSTLLRKRTEALLEGQRRVLEMIATDAPLTDSLAALLGLIEAQVPGMLGSILLLDESRAHLRHGAAPSLPQAYLAAIDGHAIGPEAGSCGTAAYGKEAVFVEDIATDPRWRNYRALALTHGLRACWSTPIFDAQRRVLGTFAMYYREPALPAPEHLRLIEMATHLAAIAISRHQTQTRLRESEAKLKEAVRIANLGYWERDLINDRITWSEETYRIWGQQRRDGSFGQAELEKMIHPDDRQLQKRALAEAVAGVRSYDVEYRIVRPDGEIRFLHVRDEIIRDGSGRPIRLFGTVQDITECKRAELALRESEQRLKSLVETAPIAIVYCDAEGFLEACNPKAVEAWGRTPSLHHPKDRYCGSLRLYHADETPMPHEDSPLARALLSGKMQVNQEMIIERPDGTKVWALANAAPVQNAKGQVTGAVVCILDITERKQAEEKVRESQQLLHLVLATLPVGVLVTDRGGNVVLTNAAAKCIWGDMIVSGPERWARSKGSWHDSGKQIAPDDWASVRALLKGQTSLNELIDIETYDGRQKTIQNSAAPIRNPEGQIVGAVVVNEDVTERVRAQQSLRESHSRLRALTARLESLREEERILIARELHDDLGQKLTGLKMDLLRAERKLEGLETSPWINSLLDTIVGATELADSITAGIQEIAANLRPELLDKLGLNAALHYESRRFQERTGILCATRLPETEPVFPAEVSTALFRIFQECLTNVARHAQATQVEAALQLEDGWVTLSVQDNGRGITETEIADPASLGLLGMKERAVLLGGEIFFQRNPGGGTEVAVRIPSNGASVQTKELACFAS